MSHPEATGPEDEVVTVKQRYKLLVPFALLGAVALGLALVFLTSMPQMAPVAKAASDQLSFVKTEYGAQDVEWQRNNLMKVTVKGKEVTCGQPSPAHREAHAPIKCTEGIVLRSNMEGNK